MKTEYKVKLVRTSSDHDEWMVIRTTSDETTHKVWSDISPLGMFMSKECATFFAEQRALEDKQALEKAAELAKSKDDVQRNTEKSD